MFAFLRNINDLQREVTTLRTELSKLACRHYELHGELCRLRRYHMLHEVEIDNTKVVKPMFSIKEGH